MSARKVNLLSQHDVDEIVQFQRYLDDLALSGPTEALYRKYQEYLGIGDDELMKILRKGIAMGTREERKNQLERVAVACPNCGQWFPRGASDDYLAECECGQEFLVGDERVTSQDKK